MVGRDLEVSVKVKVHSKRWYIHGCLYISSLCCRNHDDKLLLFAVCNYNLAWQNIQASSIYLESNAVALDLIVQTIASTPVLGSKGRDTISLPEAEYVKSGGARRS